MCVCVCVCRGQEGWKVGHKVGEGVRHQTEGGLVSHGEEERFDFECKEEALKGTDWPMT